MFLREVYEAYRGYYLDDGREECICQEESMDEESREAFLAKSERKEKGRCLGFACSAGFSARESTLKTTA